MSSQKTLNGFVSSYSYSYSYLSFTFSLSLFLGILHSLSILIPFPSPSPFPSVSPLRNNTLACHDGFYVPISLLESTPLRVSNAEFSPFPIGIHIGISEFPFDYTVIHAAEMARDTLNTNHLAYSNGNSTVVSHLVSTSCDLNDYLLVDSLFIQSSILSLVGPVCSSAVPVVSVFANEYNIPMLSPSATASDFSDKGTYPLFSRSIAPQLPIVVSLLKCIQSFHWKHVVLITTSEAFGADFLNSFNTLAPLVGVTADLTILYTINSGSLDISFLPPLLSTDVRIFILWGYVGADVLPIAQYLHSNDLLTEGNVWFVDHELWTDIVNTPNFDATLFDGWLSVSADSTSATQTQQYAQFASTWISQFGSAPSSWASLWFDSTFAVGTAIGNLLLRGEDPRDGFLLNTEIRSTHFVGLYGNFSLDSNGDPDNFPLILNNFRANFSDFTKQNFQFSIVGRFSASNNISEAGEWEYQIDNPITFPGFPAGDNTVPVDVSFSVQLVFSPSIPILSFVCSVLGCWCGIILCEQLLFDYKQWITLRGKENQREREKVRRRNLKLKENIRGNSSGGAAASITPESENRPSSSSSSFRHHLENLKEVFSSSTKSSSLHLFSQFVLSLITTSLSLSLCGIFASLWINQYGLSQSNGNSISYDSVISFTSILPISFLVSLSLLVLLWDYGRYKTVIVQKDIPTDENFDTLRIPSKRNDQNNSKGNESEMSLSLSLTVKQKQQGQQAGDTTSPSVVPLSASAPPRIFRRSRRHFTRYINLYSKLSIFSEIIRRLSLFALFGSLFLFCALLIAQLAFILSINFASASFSLSSKYLISAAILCYIGCSLSLFGFIWLVRYRWTAAVLLGATITSSGELVKNAIVIQYTPGDSGTQSASSEHTLYSSNVLFVSSLALAAVCSLLLLSLQFSRLKLSRNTLDVLMKNLKFQNEKLEKKFFGAKEEIFALENQLEEKQWIVDTVHMVRPYRHEALAQQLCQAQQFSFNFQFLILCAEREKENQKNHKISPKPNTNGKSETIPPVVLRTQSNTMVPLPLSPPNISPSTGQNLMGNNENPLLSVSDDVLEKNVPTASAIIATQNKESDTQNGQNGQNDANPLPLSLSSTEKSSPSALPVPVSVSVPLPLSLPPQMELKFIMSQSQQAQLTSQPFSQPFHHSINDPQKSENHSQSIHSQGTKGTPKGSTMGNHHFSASAPMPFPYPPNPVPVPFPFPLPLQMPMKLTRGMAMGIGASNDMMDNHNKMLVYEAAMTILNSPMQNQTALLANPTDSSSPSPLHSILSHSLPFEIFKDFCVSHHCVENVQFYFEVEKFKNISERNLRIQYGNAIMEGYVFTEAKQSINISASARKEVLQYHSDTAMPTTVFDVSQEEVFQLLLSSVWPNFLLSPQWSACQLLINTKFNWEYFEQFALTEKDIIGNIKNSREDVNSNPNPIQMQMYQQQVMAMAMAHAKGAKGTKVNGIGMGLEHKRQWDEENETKNTNGNPISQQHRNDHGEGEGEGKTKGKGQTAGQVFPYPYPYAYPYPNPAPVLNSSLLNSSIPSIDIDGFGNDNGSTNSSGQYLFPFSMGGSANGNGNVNPYGYGYNGYGYNGMSGYFPPHMMSPNHSNMNSQYDKGDGAIDLSLSLPLKKNTQTTTTGKGKAKVAPIGDPTINLPNSAESQ